MDTDLFWPDHSGFNVTRDKMISFNQNTWLLRPLWEILFCFSLNIVPMVSSKLANMVVSQGNYQQACHRTIYGKDHEATELMLFLSLLIEIHYLMFVKIVLKL